MRASSASPADKRLLFFSVILFLITGAAAVIALTSRSDNNPVVTAQAPASSGTVAANLTQMPDTPLLTGQAASDLDTVEGLITDCSDYTDARRTQIEQHLVWLRQPTTIPPKIIVALGDNPTASLLRGLATYTLSDWGLKDQSPESCLLPIGQQLNALLLTHGGEIVEAFEAAE